MVCIKVWQVGVYMCGLYKSGSWVVKIRLFIYCTQVQSCTSVAGGCVHVWFV